MSSRDRLLALLVALLWGCNFIAISVGLEHFPPLFFAGLRFAVLAVPTVLFVPRPDVPWRWVLGYGLGFGTVQFAFLFLAMDLGMPAGLASLVLQASAPFTVVLGVLLLREPIAARQVAGITLAVLGMAAIAASRAQTAAVLPVLLTLLGALGWAFGNLASRLARPEDPLRLVLWMSTVPPLPMFALSAWQEGPATGWRALGEAAAGQAWPAVAALAYIVVPATLLGSGVWTVLLRRYPAGVVAPYSLLVPVVGVLAAWLLLGERPVPLELLAGAAVVLGVLLGTPGAGRGAPLSRSARAGSTSATARRARSSAPPGARWR